MDLSSLRVVHLLKDASSSVQAPGYRVSAGSALYLDSCQRWLWIGASDPASAGDPMGEGPDAPYRVFEGSAAYDFLLSVATGLESQVVGETDIFGQLKEAWKRQKDLLQPQLKKDLSLWMQRLFEDAKEIRSRYLRNLGGSSYGSLLRRLLKDHGSLASGPTLLIGAGQLARSVAPYLLDHELWISNRTSRRAEELAFGLQQTNPSARIRALGSPGEEIAAIGQAAQIVLCVPEDPVRDPLRIRAVQALLEAGGRAQVVHLGIRGNQPGRGQWSDCGNFRSLEDLFRMDRSLSAVRSIQVERARAACREKAILHALGGGSTSITHGWEDLAAFG